MRFLFQNRYRRDVQGVSRRLLVRPNAAFNQHHMHIAAGHDVFRGVHELIDRSRKSAFQQHRRPNIPAAFNSSKFCMFRAPI